MMCSALVFRRSAQFAAAACLFFLLLGCAKPIAQFSAPESADAYGGVTLTNQSEKATGYRWNFGDGETSEEENPTHRYLKSGDYEIVLTAVDEKGKTDRQTKKISVEAPKRCLILIETPQGNMVAELYDVTSKHQDNFIKLVEQNYFDSLLFHRVITGFMIQGGDPESRSAAADARLGSGGPGYTVPAEFVDSLAHVKGALAAARTNNPQMRSSGSQFYIVDGRPVTEADLNRQESAQNFRYPTSVREEYLEKGGVPFLDQQYTVFGRVIEGLDVIDQIAALPTNGSDRPRTDVWMKVSLIR
ncbi:MAG: peptidylprolyl isomerase [Saprospiraceae bacterium]